MTKVCYTCQEVKSFDNFFNKKDAKGLHVPWNLQYLPKIENRRKRNRLQITMHTNNINIGE